MADFIKRKEKGRAAKDKVQAVTLAQEDAAFAKKYPALVEFLTLEAWDDETERARGTLTVFWQEGYFKMCLNDKDSEKVAFVSKGTFSGLLEAAEKGLVADNHDWRQSGYSKANKRK